MNKNFFRLSAIAATAAVSLCATVGAEDIDLFTTPSGGGQNPNIVIMIDNSANWDSNAQHWTCTGFSPCKQGQSELRAIRRVLDEVSDKLNLGLMMFTPGPGSTPSGAYVRYHVRQMTPGNIGVFKELIGADTGCVDGPNSLTGSPNCILKNFSTPNEKVGTAKTDYSAGLFEVFKYFGGFTYPAVAHAIPQVPGAPVDFSHFGALRYARMTGPNDPASDKFAYTASDQFTYNDVIQSNGAVSCAKNYLVFIGNGFPSQDAPCSLLQGVNGITNCTTAGQLAMPQFTMTTQTTTSTLGTDPACKTRAQCAADAATTFGTSYDTYSCTGGVASPSTPLGTDTVCETASACATRAQSLFPGHASYFCNGGTATGAVTGTDMACESAAACATRAASVFPGRSNYSCSGGSQTTGTVTLGTDSVRETIAQCIARAQAQFPGYASYNCISQTSPVASGTITLGTSGLVCETAAQCVSRMSTIFPGHTNYSCTGGVSPLTAAIVDTNCENSNQCQNGPAKAAIPSATSWTCSGGISCGSGGKNINWTMQGTCAAGTAGNYTVTASDTTYGSQIMQATGCTAAGALQGQTMSGAACTANLLMNASDACISNQTINGTKSANTVTPTNTSAPPTTSTQRFTDEWARYLYLTDVNALEGFQNVQTYTIDVFKDQQDPNETALLMSMAKYGGGRYFQATNEDAILNALRQILIEIQSVNSVFASASLPISAANRSQNENQVYIGMFRPDNKAQPRWYGNLKRFQVALFGSDAKLADKDGKEALAATTGFIQACATSYYTSSSNHNDASGNPVYYWDFSPFSAGTCTSVANSTADDLPDGSVVEKGSVAEVIRKGNDPAATYGPYTVNRKMLTCSSAPCTALTDFDSSVVTQARTGAFDPTENQAIVDFTFGKDVLDENGRDARLEPRPSIHGDITHSRPLPVNYGTGRGVHVYYGSNDGALHSVDGDNGREVWSFIAPEHHSKLIRLYKNTPQIIYPPPTDNAADARRKDYFFDGSIGIYQTFSPPTSGNSAKVLIYPSQRRGGRMVYGFDVSNELAPPVFKWAKGCPNLTDDTDCTGGMAEIGQTWSTPSVAIVKGYSTTTPVVIFGGGYDDCEDVDSATTACTASSKGHKVYVLDGFDGSLLQVFDTDRAVSSDVTLIDRDLDGMVDHAYVADMGGNLYRIDFVDPNPPPTPSSPLAARAAGAWTITKIAYTNGGSRKFMFAPAALATTDRTYLALGTGDRERPLIQNYPYTTPVLNRYYMFTDMFPTAGTPVNLDGSLLDDFTAATTCNTSMGSGQLGWRMDLNSGKGEQTVTSSVIFGGAIFFSTNRPIVADKNTCATNLGEARGYAVNLLNASGVIGTGKTCGGGRSDTFVGGGLPPSPVVGTVAVQTAEGTKTIPLLIGAANLGGDAPSFSIGGQQPPVPIQQIRSRVYWYRHGDK